MLGRNSRRLLGCALFLGFQWATSAFADFKEVKPGPKVIFAPVEKLFVASGWDDNDTIQVSVYGNLPSIKCYRVGTTGHSIDLENKKISIWVTAYDFSANGDCGNIPNTFLLNENIGVIPEGVYSIEVASQTIGKEVKGTVEVKKSTSDTPDEFLYAPVTHTEITHSTVAGKQIAIIGGEFPRMMTGCMRLVEVRSHKSPGNVLVIQPIAEEVTDEAICINVPLKFEAEVEFDSFVDLGLLHVRVSNGNSETRLIKRP